jgi:signal peptidase I
VTSVPSGGRGDDDRQPPDRASDREPDHESGRAAPVEPDGESDETSDKESDNARTPLPLWQEALLLLAVALVLAMVVKAFFLQAFFVPSVSMEPTFLQQDRILVEKWSYWAGDVQRGDVVVFDDPGGWLGPSESRKPGNAVQEALEAFGLYPTGGHLVKRVIGVAGDEVRCCDADGRVTVNGAPLEELDYLAAGARPSDQRFEVEVPEGSLWVMGDNRPESGDSRAHLGSPGGGFVPVDDVVGKVWAIVWPAGRAEILDRPDTFDNPALDGS